MASQIRGFPDVAEVIRVVQLYVDRQLGGQWPEDDWIDFGESWSINIYCNETGNQMAVYRDYINEDGFRTTDPDEWLHIP